MTLSAQSPSQSTSPLINFAIRQVEQFCFENPELGHSSHGFEHAKKVHNHAIHALQCLQTKPAQDVCENIELAALMHDLDDHKYFPNHSSHIAEEFLQSKYPNALKLLSNLDPKLSPKRQNHIIYLISLVSCSQNGNSVPPDIHSSQSFHLLIPRWADRLEAIGPIGVVRCYQYNQERNYKISSFSSPRPQSEEEVWQYATPQRFQDYQESGGSSEDMISHYYDKLLHVARPPPEIVHNKYLERVAKERVKDLLEVCLSFGKTGDVDVEYILQLEKSIER